jgi:hypothetical protein
MTVAKSIKFLKDVTFLKDNNITVADIAEELNYRENSNNLKWNDALYDFSTEELTELERLLT